MNSTDNSTNITTTNETQQYNLTKHFWGSANLTVKQSLEIACMFAEILLLPNHFILNKEALSCLQLSK